MVEKKVTSYRLSLLTLKMLDDLVEEYNKVQNDISSSIGFKHGKKITKADVLDMLISLEWSKTQDSIKDRKVLEDDTN